MKEADKENKTVTKAEFARQMGVDRRTPGKWIRAGRISVEANGRIDPEKAMAELKDSGSVKPHHMARQVALSHASDTDEGAQPTPEDLSQAEAGEKSEGGTPSVNLRLQLARALYEETRAETAQMDRDQKAGLLVLRSDAEFVLSDMARKLESLLDRQVDQLTPDLVALGSDAHAIHSAITEAHRDLRQELSAHLHQRQREFGQ